MSDEFGDALPPIWRTLARVQHVDVDSSGASETETETEPMNENMTEDEWEMPEPAREGNDETDTTDEVIFEEPPRATRVTDADRRADDWVAHVILRRGAYARVPQGLGRARVLSAFGRAGHAGEVTSRTVNGERVLYAKATEEISPSDAEAATPVPDAPDNI